MISGRQQACSQLGQRLPQVHGRYLLFCKLDAKTHGDTNLIGIDKVLFVTFISPTLCKPGELMGKFPCYRNINEFDYEMLLLIPLGVGVTHLRKI